MFADILPPGSESKNKLLMNVGLLHSILQVHETKELRWRKQDIEQGLDDISSLYEIYKFEERKPILKQRVYE